VGSETGCGHAQQVHRTQPTQKGSTQLCSVAQTGKKTIGLRRLLFFRL
jgi:hypothetical protein